LFRFLVVFSEEALYGDHFYLDVDEMTRRVLTVIH